MLHDRLLLILILVVACYAVIALIAPSRARALGGEDIAAEWAQTAGTIPLLFLTTLAAIVGAILAPGVGLGAVARVLQGGVLEEVIYRWGLMTFLALVGAVLVGRASDVVMWFAIVGAGIVFGLAHLSGARLLGVRRTPWLVGTAVFVNLWLGAICGWPFWQYGLLSAMLAHGTVHGIWISFDGWAYRRTAVSA